MNAEFDGQKMYNEMKNYSKSNYFLYRHFAEDKTLLYVGISVSAIHRLSQHKSRSFWFKEISFVTIEKFSSRSEVLKAEKKAIEKELPLYNKTHMLSCKKQKPSSTEGRWLEFQQQRRNEQLKIKEDNLKDEAIIQQDLAWVDGQWERLGWDELPDGRHCKRATGEIVGTSR
jgi:predicted GIY-YIG superfamily endonuclease